ncbi:MAG: hypothetical protein ACI4VV_02275 [Eggerthellaceae bacterium]
MRVAVIDVGSNTVHMCAYDVEEQAGRPFPKRLFKVKKQLGLAAYIDQDGNLTKEGEDRCIDAVQQLVGIARTSSIDQVHVFATATIRQATNRKQVVKRIQHQCNVSLEVLSSEEEALMDFDAVSYELDASDGILADIGGGSSEVVRFSGKAPVLVLGFPLGSLRLFRDFVDDVLPSTSERVAIEDAVAAHLQKPEWGALGESKTLYAVGGSCRAALKLLSHCFPASVDQRAFPVLALDALLSDFAQNRRLAVRSITQVCPDRIHTALPGMLVLQYLAHAVRADRIVVGSFGVREGYLIRRVFSQKSKGEGKRGKQL